MKTIRLSEKEIEFLSALYEDEIKQTEAYIGQLKEILAKLGRKADSGFTEIKAEPKKRGRKPRQKTATEEPVKIPKKRGRKPGKKAAKPAAVKKETPRIEKKKPARKKRIVKVHNYKIKPKPLPKLVAPVPESLETAEKKD